MKRTLIGLYSVAVFFFGCESDDDKADIDAPTITMSEPASGEAFAAGGEIHFEALFEDNVALATYNVTIHNNFDEHSHSRLAVTPFTFDQSYSISGTSAEVHEHVEVDAEATAGPYHFIVQAIDAAGNSTSFADGSAIESEIWITNEEMAHVHFQDENGVEVEEYEGVVGQALSFYGEIEDESGELEHVLISVGHLEAEAEHDHDHSDSRIAEDDHIYEEEFEVEGQTSVLIQDLLADASIVVEQADLDELEEGEHLYLIVRVEDTEGNISQYAIELHFD